MDQNIEIKILQQQIRDLKNKLFESTIVQPRDFRESNINKQLPKVTVELPDHYGEPKEAKVFWTEEKENEIHVCVRVEQYDKLEKENQELRADKLRLLNIIKKQRDSRKNLQNKTK